MQSLHPVFLSFPQRYPEGSDIRAALRRKTRPVVLSPLWNRARGVEKVRAWMGYSEAEIFLYFEVTETSVKAECFHDGDPVWNDSCVEFFVQSFQDERIYYNFEWNALGTCLYACGSEKQGRETPDVAQYANIRRFPEMEPKPFPETGRDHPWGLTVTVPFSLLGRQGNSELRSLRGNLYKCGNGMKHPHYLAWAPIHTHNPDFHRPEYFGIFRFTPEES